MDPLQLGADLVATMMDHQGLGLSANQIGYPYRVFCMRTSPQNTVVFNPKIIHVDPGEELAEEGCLSFPELVIKIKRYKLIRARFWYPNGEFKTETFKDLTARVFQHETDHVNGVVFQDRATLFHKDQAERQQAKRIRNKRRWEEKHGPIDPESKMEMIKKRVAELGVAANV